MRSSLFAVLIALPLFGQAEQTCHWINAATVASILGRPVNSTVKKKADYTACEFGSLHSPVYRLRAQIGPLPRGAGKWSAMESLTCYNHQPEALTGIGNEAAACIKDAHGRRCEEIVGRVRDQLFSITLMTSDRSASTASLIEKTREIAEQVSANLF